MAYVNKAKTVPDLKDEMRQVIEKLPKSCTGGKWLGIKWKLQMTKTKVTHGGHLDDFVL